MALVNSIINTLSMAVEETTERINSKLEEKRHERLYKISASRGAREYIDSNCDLVLKEFQEKGFVTISLIPHKDLKAGFLKKPFMVEEVSIGGDNRFTNRTLFYPDEPVSIVYHVFYDSTAEIQTYTLDLDSIPEEFKEDSYQADKTKTKLNFCPYCGYQLKDDMKFCPGCGNKLPV